MQVFIKNILLFIVVIISLLISIIFYLEYTEQRYTHWNTTNEMNIPDVFQYGWIPTWFPRNAMNIHEQHDIDTNHVWIKFELPDNNNTTFIQYFKLLKPHEINSIEIKTPFLANWWFEDLIEHSYKNNTLHLTIYQGKGKKISKNVFLAKDRLTNSYYIWILGS